MTNFDIIGLLDDHLINSDAVVGLAGKFGIKVPDKATIAKWYSRKSIPGAWLPIVICLIELHEGKSVSLTAYLERSACNADDIFA